MFLDSVTDRDARRDTEIVRRVQEADAVFGMRRPDTSPTELWSLDLACYIHLVFVAQFRCRAP